MRGLSKEGGDAEGIDVRGAKGAESVDGMRNVGFPPGQPTTESVGTS